MRQLNEYEAELVAGGLSESDNYGDGTYATYDGDGGWTIDGSSNLYGGWDGYYDLTGGQSGLYGGGGGSGSGSGGLPLTSETDTDGDGIMDDVDPDADGDGVKDDEIVVESDPLRDTLTDWVRQNWSTFVAALAQNNAPQDAKSALIASVLGTVAGNMSADEAARFAGYLYDHPDQAVLFNVVPGLAVGAYVGEQLQQSIP